MGEEGGPAVSSGNPRVLRRPAQGLPSAGRGGAGGRRWGGCLQASWVLKGLIIRGSRNLAVTRPRYKWPGQARAWLSTCIITHFPPLSGFQLWVQVQPLSPPLLVGGSPRFRVDSLCCEIAPRKPRLPLQLGYPVGPLSRAACPLWPALSCVWAAGK